jgi:phosphonate transport system substrate-binding protein
VAVLTVVITVMSGCTLGPAARRPLCGPSGTLRVGVMDSAEGQGSAASAGLSPQESEGLRNLLIQASGCDVEVEPLASPERARTKLAARQWDAAFLPPGLTAFSLRPELGYVALRTLGQRQTSRSAMLVLDGSRLRQLSDLNGAHVGLLPRGSLGGFYIPLYNMHGLSLGRVSYALNYPSLLAMLQRGEVDVIAWDEALPDPGSGVRRLQVDGHAIPLGALVLSGDLAGADYIPFLKTLDDAAAQMPGSLGYAASVLPLQQELQTLKAIVNSVESWSLPFDGQPYRVFGRKVAS